VRVPLLLRLPPQLTDSLQRQTASRRVRAPVSQIDVVPTLLDLMGQPIPASLQGESLRPLIDGDERARARDVFIEWNGHNNGFGDVIGSVSVPEPMRDLGSPDEIIAAITDPVRTVVTADGWKLNLSPLGEHELYHLDEDLYETRNLAGQAGMAPKMRELAGRICRWQERTGDRVKVPLLGKS
jgi:arylsulfatase A-like enzyme